MERRQPGRHRKLGPYKIYELCTGHAIYPQAGYSGYGDGEDTDMQNFISEAMRLDWEDNRKELLKFWNSGQYTLSYFSPSDTRPWLFVRGSKDTLPWAAKIFDEGDGNEPKIALPSQPCA